MAEVREGSEFIYKSKPCYGCLSFISKDRNARNCKNRRSCKKCHKKHLRTLHGLKIEKKTTFTDKTNSDNNISTDNTLVQEGNESGEMLSCNSTYFTSEAVKMCVVLVKVKYVSSPVVETYAMLDSCSEGTFIENGLLEEQKISGRSTNITVKTLNGERSKESVLIDGLEVSNAKKFNSFGKWIIMPKTCSRDKLSIGGGSFTSKQRQRWTYLDKIQGEICLGKYVNIKILIGTNCSEALEPVKVINSENGGPYAFKTVLGWCAVSPVNSTQAKRKFCCNRTAVIEAGTNEIVKLNFKKRNSIVETDTKQMLNKTYESDFTEAKLGKRPLLDAEEVSFEDKKFLEIMDTGGWTLSSTIAIQE